MNQAGFSSAPSLFNHPNIGQPRIGDIVAASGKIIDWMNSTLRSHSVQVGFTLKGIKGVSRNPTNRLFRIRQFRLLVFIAFSLTDCVLRVITLQIRVLDII